MKKAWTVFLSTLSVALAVAIGVGSSGFTNWHVKEWFNRWGKGEEQQEPAPPKAEGDGVLGTLGGGMVMSAEGIGAPVQFASYAIEREAYAANGISAQSDSAYTVTATVAPDNEATNTAILWSLSWKNADSAWASGKTVTDYVTATPNGEGYVESKTVTLACTQSFGEPIILTATCKYATEITAALQLDYKARFKLLQPCFTNETFPMNVDAEGTPANVGFGRDSEVTLELSSAYSLNSRCHSLYPMSLNYEILGSCTVSEDYHFVLSSKQLGEGILLSGSSYPYCWKGTTNDLGEREIGNGGNGTIVFSDQDYTTDNIDFANFPLEVPLRLSDAGSVLYDLQYCIYQQGSGGMQPVYYSLAQDFSNSMATLLQKLNQAKSTTYNGRIPFCILELTVTGTTEEYKYSTDVYITKIIKSTKITGVTLDNGAITI